MQGTRGRRQRVAMGALAALFALAMAASSAAAAPPSISGVAVSDVSTSTVTLEAKVNPEGLATRYRFEYGTADCSKSACTKAPSPEGELAADSSPVPVSVSVEGLAPGSVYHYRVVAKNANGTISSQDRVFATYSPPLIGLPDGRAYEQSSPVDKDGGDAVGDLALVKAAADGNGISFGSDFGIPGGKGAQELPSYLSQRGAGQGGWSTQGLLPPATSGQRAQVIGWSPNYTEVFSKVARLGDEIKTAFLVQDTAGGQPTEIAPYTTGAQYSYVGQSSDSAVVFFESTAKLAPEAIKGASNLYAWDRTSAKTSLAGVLNDESSPPKGTFAGPYDWAKGISGKTLREGGAQRNYYLQAEHAVSQDGNVFFTEAGTGQLYLRINPTQAQSPISAGKCTNPTLACTIHVSASQKTDGQSESGTDPAGPQPAAFQAASADGSEVFFSSPEKLTNQANTGPEQKEATISLGNISGGIEEEKFLPEHAIGVAVDAEYIYWAEPILGTIGRAKLNGSGKPSEIEKAFITPGPVEFEVSPGVKESVESKPRYVAVDAGHVYWTNTGRLEENGEPLDGGGTIGRADIDGTEASIEPDFISGASNPQGIAVNATHVYWANAGKSGTTRTIGRAEISGAGVEEGFFRPQASDSRIPHGVVLSPSHVYFALNEAASNSAFIGYIPLNGGAEELHFIGKAGIRGLATDASHIYWATQSEEAIGRADLELTPASIEKAFIPIEGSPVGLAADAAHLYWSLNGEASANPGNDLYRYLPASNTLEDLTALGSGDGAEVQGLVGASDDGSQLYFVANGDLDQGGPAVAGDCQTSTPHGSIATTAGNCNLYVWQGGTTSLVARLKAGGDTASDAVDWTATPREVFSGGFYVPKSAFTSPDGRTLLFRSQEQLTPYDNEGAPELYRYRVGDSQLRCASCAPSGEAAGQGPSLGSILYPGIGPLGTVAGTTSRNLSADGKHAFFESAEALSPLDTNGAGGCPPSGTSAQGFPNCLDVYEWEAPETPACQESSPSYSPLNGGCVYLISTGKSEFPSLFADASESGEDVFFFTRQQLVGQDQDQLQDVYDARLGGGLASQNPTPPLPCESAQGCHEAPPPLPAQSTPVTPSFAGPGNQAQKHKKQKPKKKHKKKHQAKKHKKAKSKGRAAR